MSWMRKLVVFEAPNTFDSELQFNSDQIASHTYWHLFLSYIHQRQEALQPCFASNSNCSRQLFGRAKVV